MTIKIMQWLIVWLLVSPQLDIWGANFTTGSGSASKFGVHEIQLFGDAGLGNPFDTQVSVSFTPTSGAIGSRTVQAFYDGGDTWRARVYVSEVGAWQWTSRCASDSRLDGQSGSFVAEDSQLRGRLLPHRLNARQWMTENGRWFLNLNDTAYFLLCARDGNGDAVSDEDALQYVHDDVERGIASVRCFAASGDAGFIQSSDQWQAWHFADETCDRLRLEHLQCTDRRLRMMLESFPDVAVQLIMFPLEAYGRDDRFWTALSKPQRERLLRNLVARYAAYPQIFWLMTNDAHYGDKFPNSNAMVREVGAYLQQRDPWQHPRSTGHARKVPFYFGGEEWATYIHIEHEHDLGALQYANYHEFAKPAFLGEDRYENDHRLQGNPTHMRYWQRRLFWAWLLAGGSANYGGRWWTVQPYSQTGQRAATYYERPKNTFRQSLVGLDSVRFIREYFGQRGIELSAFEPDQALARAPDVTLELRAPKLARRGHEEFLIYHPHAAADGQAAQVQMSSAARLQIDLRGGTGEYGVEWFRAEDGQTQLADNVPAGDWRELIAPWNAADVVVRLWRK